MFSGFDFVVIPNLTNKVAIFRKNLYKKNGASVTHTLSKSTESDHTYFVIEDSGPKVDKKLIIKSLRLKNVQDGDNLITKFPILKKEWVTDSLLEGKIGDILKYTYHVEGVKVDQNLKSKMGADQNVKKRRLRNQSTEQQSKLLKIDGSSSDPTEDEKLFEEDHSNSKNLLSSKRQLLLLNSEQHDSINSNGLIIEYFNKMAEEYKKNGDSFKYVNYKKAVNTILSLDHKLVSYDEAISLPNIGKRLASKIEQINKTGYLTQLDELKKDPKLQILQAFTNIYGVGQTVANTWYDQGFRSVDEISKLSTLTKNQRLGIEFYKDWNSKIPRDEVEKHIEYVTDVLASIDEKLEIICTGSYRRGLKECGDVDFILLKKDCNEPNELSQLLHQLVLDLMKQGYVKCSLMGIGPKMRKFYGGGKLPQYELCRRIDFLVYPWVSKGAALVYFTGNDILNRSMRQLASDKNLHLNDKGLFKDFNTKNEQVLESFDERLIFEKLGVTYREPTDRNIGNFNELKKD